MPPRLARLLAVIAAIALIGGAFWYRGRGDEDGSNQPGSVDGNGQLSIVCITELARICRAAVGNNARVTVADAGKTAAALAKSSPADPPFDAWITLDPWPEMAAVQRGQEPTIFGDVPTVVGSTPLSAMAPADRYRAFVEICGDPVSWFCVADQAGKEWRSVAPGNAAAQSWGPVKVGVGDPDTGIGRLVLGQLVSSIAKENSLPDDPGVAEFNPYIQQLRAPYDSAVQLASSDEIDALVTTGPATFSIVAGTAPDVEAGVGTPQGQQKQLRTAGLTTPARADAVVAPLVAGERGRRVVELFTGQTGTKAFNAARWTPGAPPGGNGMPAPDVLVALREKIN